MRLSAAGVDSPQMAGIGPLDPSSLRPAEVLTPLLKKVVDTIYHFRISEMVAASRFDTTSIIKSLEQS